MSRGLGDVYKRQILLLDNPLNVTQLPIATALISPIFISSQFSVFLIPLKLSFQVLKSTIVSFVGTV